MKGVESVQKKSVINYKHPLVHFILKNGDYQTSIKNNLNVG